IDDKYVEHAMRVLAKPIGDDPKIISGESGASTMGLLLELLENKELSDLRDIAKIDEKSQILVFSTEGNTDPINYELIINN
ncbi:MAG: diaminopropionate ammonia-lyase, partial [Oscillospiraceae bacterium]|nr:diaminopropionate ammonia-lyase [Oscillospiraceae bacterium]